MIRFFSWFFLIVGALCAGVRADAPTTTQPASDPALDAQLSDVNAKSAKITDLAANFRQRKFTALLKKPLESSGTVRAVGNTVRWDTKAPDDSMLYTDGKQLILYYPSQKLEEIYPIDQRMSDLLASPLPRLDVIRAHFSIGRALPAAFAGVRASSQTLALRLVPTEDALKPHIQEILVLLNTQNGLVLAVQTTDPDGDISLIQFTDAKIDTGARPQELAPTIPADTTVSRPLGDSGAGGANQSQ